jgi:hypothetical protein
MRFKASWRVVRPVLFVTALLVAGAAGFNPAASAAATTYSITPKDTVVTGNLGSNATFTFTITAILIGTPFQFAVQCHTTTLTGKTPATAGDLTIPLRSEAFTGCGIEGSSPPSKVTVTTSGSWSLKLSSPPGTGILTTLHIAHLVAKVPFFGSGCEYTVSGGILGTYNNAGAFHLQNPIAYTETSACPPAFPSGQQFMTMSGTFHFDPVFKEVS